MKKIFTSIIAATLAAGTVAAASYTGGIFLLNEDWFGHNASSVNFYSYDGDSIVYRAYQAANPGSTLGNTAEYAAIDGDNIYFCSKQNYGSTGGRLVVADAKTLEKKASIDAIGDADTRAFLTVSDTKAYISTSAGVYTYQHGGPGHCRHHWRGGQHGARGRQGACRKQ